jgi:hypothetical protein
MANDDQVVNKPRTDTPSTGTSIASPQETYWLGCHDYQTI